MTEPKGWLVPADRMAWDRDDWADAYSDDAYGHSVIWASDDAALLKMPDLHRLLHQHGSNAAELEAGIADGQQQGMVTLPLNHAAQALAWLGY